MPLIVLLPAELRLLVNSGLPEPSGQMLNVYRVPAVTVFAIAETADIKRIADHFNRHLLTQLVYQRVRFRSSDIKRVVAFFSMVFSISRRLQRASSS